MLDLPEPFVDLILSHSELLSQFNSELSGRHFSFVLLVNSPQNLHLLRLLSISSPLIVVFIKYTGISDH